jgi:hypothetical protein
MLYDFDMLCFVLIELFCSMRWSFNIFILTLFVVVCCCCCRRCWCCFVVVAVVVVVVVVVVCDRVRVYVCGSFFLCDRPRALKEISTSKFGILLPQPQRVPPTLSNKNKQTCMLCGVLLPPPTHTYVQKNEK